MKKISGLVLGIFLLSFCGFHVPASAYDNSGGYSFADRFTDPYNWEFRVASGVHSTPKYEGSDETEARFLFFANASFDDGRFFIGTEGIGIEPLRTERLRLMLGIGHEWGRDESDDRKNLRGMGDVDDSFTGMARLTYSLDRIRFGTGVASAINGDYGTTVEVFADSRTPLGGNFSLNWKIFSQWANDEHMENYFGVSPGQSAESGKRVYRASSGFKKIGVEMGLDLKIYGNFGIGMAGSATQLLGDAADSPLCRDETQLEGRFFFLIGF